MLAIGIILVVLLLIALLRFGAILEYSDAGFEMWLKVGPFKKAMKSDTSPGSGLDKIFTLLKAQKDKKKKKKVHTRQSPAISDILKAVKKAISRLKRRLLIKQLVLYCTLAGDDPVKVVNQYGIANALLGAIAPKLECNNMIKHHDIRTGIDFATFTPRIYAKFNISIALWEIIYVAIALLPLLIPKRRESKPATEVT